MMMTTGVNDLLVAVFGNPAPGVYLTDEGAMLTEQQEFFLRGILQTLPHRLIDVLSCRFGLLDGRHRTLKDVGNIMGVSIERVRQIESKALKMLRHPTRARFLRDLQVVEP